MFFAIKNVLKVKEVPFKFIYSYSKLFIYFGALKDRIKFTLFECQSGLLGLLGF